MHLKYLDLPTSNLERCDTKGKGEQLHEKRSGKMSLLLMVQFETPWPQSCISSSSFPVEIANRTLPSGQSTFHFGPFVVLSKPSPLQDLSTFVSPPSWHLRPTVSTLLLKLQGVVLHGNPPPYHSFHSPPAPNQCRLPNKHLHVVCPPHQHFQQTMV